VSCYVKDVIPLCVIKYMLQCVAVCCSVLNACHHVTHSNVSCYIKNVIPFCVIMYILQCVAWYDGNLPNVSCYAMNGSCVM